MTINIMSITIVTIRIKLSMKTLSITIFSTITLSIITKNPHYDTQHTGSECTKFSKMTLGIASFSLMTPRMIKTQRNDTLHNVIQYKETEHNDTQNKQNPV
jgi:hypothetical protein